MSGGLFALALSLALLWPLLVALRALPVPRLDALWITAPLPALLLALVGAPGELVLDAWLLGGVWRLDALRGPLLAFTALLWLLAGGYARGYLAGERHQARAGDSAAARRLARFTRLWPLTLAGNLLLLVAEDIASFYLGFAVMTFAAYGLVVHAGSRDARLGGFAYLVMALLGEGMLLAGLLWGAGATGTLTLTGLREGLGATPAGAWIALLLWLGFGVKAGLVGLHLWLPLAHPVAPTPASAVLSGAMIKAGLVGWMQVLPLGDPTLGEAFTWLGRGMLLAGLAGAFGAALIGVCQRHPKAVLAYSSISQMGMLTVLVAMGLLAPGLWPSLAATVVLFAAHHGLTKGALFLGVGVGEHPPRLPTWLLWGLLVLPALSLAGGLGSGLATKWAFKEVLYTGGHQGLVTWLSLAGVGTTALMARTLWCQWQGARQAQAADRRTLSGSMSVTWLATLLTALTLPWWLGTPLASAAWPPPAELAGLWWPLALGLALACGIGGLIYRRPPRLTWRLPAGDLWWPLARGARRWAAWGRRCLDWLAAFQALRGRRLAALERRLVARLTAVTRGEAWLRRQGGLLMVGLGALLVLVMLLELA